MITKRWNWGVAKVSRNDDRSVGRAKENSSSLFPVLGSSFPSSFNTKFHTSLHTLTQIDYLFGRTALFFLAQQAGSPQRTTGQKDVSRKNVSNVSTLNLDTCRTSTTPHSSRLLPYISSLCKLASTPDLQHSLCSTQICSVQKAVQLGSSFRRTLTNLDSKT